MPKSWQRYFQSMTLEKHLLIAVALGLFARALSAHFVYGPQALDDYKHGVWPAYQFFIDQSLDIPNYRSHFLVWILSSFIWVGSLFGVSSALTQVRCIYLGLGVISLLGIWGTYFYVRNYSSRIFGALAIYLVALHGIMPFISTRAFGEAAAVPFVLLGFGLLEDQRARTKRRVGVILTAMVILGIAVSLRFHVGLLLIGYAACMIFLREWKILILGVLGSLSILALQAGIDFLSDKAPFETLRVYLAENEGGAAKYGVSPWYNTWVFALGLTLFPFSLVFIKGLTKVWRQHWTLIVPLLLFIAAHSMAAHKEERFLYPIVGMLWIVLASAWSESLKSKWARKVYTPVFVFVNVLLLLVTCFVNTQEGEIAPAAYAEKKFGSVLYLDHNSLFGKSRFLFYFLRPPSERVDIDPEQMQMTRVDQELQSRPTIHAVMLMTSDEADVGYLRALENVKTVYSQCEEMREAQSLVDKVLFRLNPKHNQRRRPTWYVACARTAEGI